MSQINLTNNNGRIRIRFKHQRITYNISTLGKYTNPIDRSKAKILAASIELDIQLGQFDSTLEKYIGAPKPKSHPMLPIWDLWVATLELSESTKADHYVVIRRAIEKIKPPPEIYDSKWFVKSAENLASSTFNTRLRFLSKFSNWALEEGYLKTNPYLKLEGRKGSRQKTNPLTIHQIKSILQKFSELQPQYSKFATFLFLTGCRHSEAIGLTWDKVNLELGEIEISETLVKGRKKGTKTGLVTVLQMSQNLRVLIESIDRNESDQYVFTNLNGDPVHINTYGYAWKKVLEALEIPHVKPYVSRHSFASNAIDGGLSIEEVARILGHADTTMVQRHYVSSLSKVNLPELGL